MINGLKFAFSKSDTNVYIEVEGVGGKIPDDCIISTELFLLSSEGIREIVAELEEVKSRERESSKFGFETTLVFVYKEGFKNDVVYFPKGKVYIDYNYGKNELETDLTVDDILKMMTEYRDYVDAWEKETGKVKKGG